jgi:rhomboid protease GluP
MCRNCGAIVGGGESQCAVCGASVTALPGARPAPRAPDRETLRFARAVLSRPYKFTIIFLIANFFIFLLMWQSSGMNSAALWVIPPPVLIAYGAKLNSLIREQHQWWRLVAPMFEHVNLIHLLVNMYSLWIVGPYVEKLYGSAKFVFFWVATGVIAMVASYLAVVKGPVPAGLLGRFILRSRDVPAAGASGALFGLVGVLFVFGIKFRHELPEGFKRAFGTGLLPMIALNLFIGYLGRGLFDNAAHLGGLLSGAVLALVVDYRRPGERKEVALVWRLLQVAALGLVALSFFKVAQHFNDPLPLPVIQSLQPPNNEPSTSVKYFGAMNEAQEALIAFLHDKDPSALDKATKQLEALPAFDENADKLRDRLRALLTKAKELSARSTSSSEPLPQDVQQQWNELVKEFDSWTTEYDHWLRTDARKYGVVVDTGQGEPSPN